MRLCARLTTCGGAGPSEGEWGGAHSSSARGVASVHGFGGTGPTHTEVWFVELDQCPGRGGGGTVSNMVIVQGESVALLGSKQDRGKPGCRGVWRVEFPGRQGLGTADPG